MGFIRGESLQRRWASFYSRPSCCYSLGVRTGSAVYSCEGIPDAGIGYIVTAFLQSLYFSTVTFTALGYGNIEPVGQVGQYVAGTEALVGSRLVALLIPVFTKSTWLR